MRAEEGDESINDYAAEARQAQGNVGGPLSLPQKILRFFGLGRSDGGGPQGEHRQNSKP